jgi:hypothetical protein
MQLREPDERDIQEREALIEELNKVLAAAFPWPSHVTGQRGGASHQLEVVALLPYAEADVFVASPYAVLPFGSFVSQW